MSSKQIRNKLIEHHQYITTYGEDMPEVTDWQWGYYSLGAESIAVSAERSLRQREASRSRSVSERREGRSSTNDGSQQTSTDSPSTKGGEGAANSRE